MVPVNRGHGAAGQLVATSFSKDDRYQVTAGQDFTARIWDARAGRQISLPLFHDLPVWSAAFQCGWKIRAKGTGRRHGKAVGMGERTRTGAFGAGKRGEAGGVWPERPKYYRGHLRTSGHLLKFRAWEWQPQNPSMKLAERLDTDFRSAIGGCFLVPRNTSRYVKQGWLHPARQSDGRW